MRSAVRCGSSRSVSRVPGAPPRTSTAATAGSSNTIAVTPDASRASSAFPTKTPATSVMRLRCAMKPRQRARQRTRITRSSHHGEQRIAGLHRSANASHLAAMVADVTVLAALVAGLVSFLSPCVLPLVPPYLVYLAGISLERFADREPEPRVKRETVVAAALFVLGFSTVFVALGASASAVGG